MASEYGLKQPLRDDIGKPPVGGSRVRVVLDREAKVSLYRLSGTFQNVFARADQLDDCQRDVGKVIRISCLSLKQEIIQSFGIGIGRKLPAVGSGQLNNPVPALGSFCAPQLHWPRS